MRGVRPRAIWRHTSLGVLLGLSLALAASSGCQLLGSGGAAGLTGRIAWPRNGDLWVLDLPSKRETKVTSVPSSAAVLSGAWSPDGTRLVYSQLWRRPGARTSGADLFVVNADGSGARPFAEREQENGVLETPVWAASGRIYYTVRTVESGRESLRIVRHAEGGAPEVLVQDGASPSVSADESVLVFIRSTRDGQALMRKRLDGSDDECQLLPAQVFPFLSLPRIARDGARVAFGASGEPNVAPGTCGGQLGAQPARESQPSRPLLASWLSPPTAYAHGAPSDVWSVGIDGSNLSRLVDLKEDDPTVAWSPDGARLAIFGVSALYVANPNGGRPEKLVDQGGYGGLDWIQ